MSSRPGRNISLDKQAQRQNVLLVRTKDENGLSAPITFDAIRSQSLPLARSDINSEYNDHVIRVPLRTAIHFILDLQRRDEMADPGLHPRRRDKFVLADVYVAEMMREADEKGIDKVHQVKSTLRTVEEGKPYEYGKFGFWSPH